MDFKKLASQVIDFYDDQSYLLNIYKSESEIPEAIKKASLNAKDHEYAISVDGFKKYPINDEGNFYLSLIYYNKYAHELPKELYKEATLNLMESLTRWKKPIPSELKDMADDLKSKGIEVQTRTRDWDDRFNTEDVMKDSGYSLSGERLTKKEIPPVKREKGPFDRFRESIDKKDKTEKVAAVYPMNTFSQIKEATKYFDNYYKDFSLEERRDFSTILEKRANDLMEDTSPIVKKYASNSYDPNFTSYTNLRKQFIPIDAHYVVDELIKNADSVSATKYAEALKTLDEEFGLDFFWDKTLPDPYYSTLGIEKKAEDNWRYSYREVHINKDHLKLLTNRFHQLKDMFGPEIAEDFIRDPIKTFNRLNDEQKYIAARYASGEYTT